MNVLCIVTTRDEVKGCAHEPTREPTNSLRIDVADQLRIGFQPCQDYVSARVRLSSRVPARTCLLACHLCAKVARWIRDTLAPSRARCRWLVPHHTLPAVQHVPSGQLHHQERRSSHHHRDRFPKYAARPSLADCKNDALLRQRAKVVRVWVHSLHIHGKHRGRTRHEHSTNDWVAIHNHHTGLVRKLPHVVRHRMQGDAESTRHGLFETLQMPTFCVRSNH